MHFDIGVYGESIGTDPSSLANSCEAFQTFDKQFPLLLAGVPPNKGKGSTSSSVIWDGRGGIDIKVIRLNS